MKLLGVENNKRWEGKGKGPKRCYNGRKEVKTGKGEGVKDYYREEIMEKKGIKEGL